MDREEALRRAKKKRMGRYLEAPMTAGPIPKRRMTIGQKERLKEMQRRRQAQQAAGMVMGAAVSVAKKDKINKNVKDKIKKIGEMKVKDVASSIGKAFAVTTPIGIGRTISRKIQQATNKTPSKQERIERTAPRMPKLMDKFLREKNKRRPERLLTGGQAKIAAKAPPPNKITGADFAVLKKEKAKGRGKGLQDEKMKPGKIIKAKKSKFIERRKELMGLGTILRKDPTKAINRVGVKDRYGMDIKPKTSQLGKDLASKAARAAKATRLGKIALGVAGAALATKEYLKSKMNKKVDKKMGGGMMMRPNPVGYKTGKMIKARGCKLGKNKPTKMY